MDNIKDTTNNEVIDEYLENIDKNIEKIEWGKISIEIQNRKAVRLVEEKSIK